MGLTVPLAKVSVWSLDPDLNCLTLHLLAARELRMVLTKDIPMSVPTGAFSGAKWKALFLDPVL